MQRRRVVRAGVGVLTAAMMAVSGCDSTASSTDDGGGKPVGAPAQDASAALAQAAVKLADDSFKMTMKMGSTGEMTGSMDPKKRIGSFQTTASSEGTTVTTEMRMIGDDTYIKMTTPGAGLPGMDGKTWRRLSRSTKSGPMTLGSFDGAQIAKTLEDAADVQRVGDKGFRGTLDLTKSAKALGAPTTGAGALNTNTIPFEATVDEQGRLVRYVFDSPGVGSVPSQKIEITYSDFGTPVDVQAPPADQVSDMPRR